MTEDNTPISGPTPAEALAAIAESRKTVHDRVAVGGWRYDLTYAALVAVMVGGQAFGNPFNVSASTLGLLGLVLLFQHETDARACGSPACRRVTPAGWPSPSDCSPPPSSSA